MPRVLLIMATEHRHSPPAGCLRSRHPKKPPDVQFRNSGNPKLAVLFDMDEFMEEEPVRLLRLRVTSRQGSRLFKL